MSINIFSKLLILSIVITVACNPSYGAEGPEMTDQESNKDPSKENQFDTCISETKSALSGISLKLSIGGEINNWKVGTRSSKEDQEKVIDYDSEGLACARLQLSLGSQNYPVLYTMYETPFNPSDRQNEMLRVNSKQEGGMELFTGYIDIAPIVKYIMPSNSFLGAVAEFLFSVRFKYTRDLFYCDADVLKPSYYVPMTATIDYVERVLSGIAKLEPGEEITFKSQFDYQEITLPLFDLGDPETKFTTHKFRMGYFQMKYGKPTDAVGLQVDRLPLICETEYESQGLVIAFQTIDPNAAGLNFDLSVGLGINNSVKSAIDFDQVYGKKTEASFAMCTLAIWYNLYFGKKNNSGFFTTVGGSVQPVIAVIKTDEDNSYSAIFRDEDTLFKGFFSIGYSF